MAVRTYILGPESIVVPGTNPNGFAQDVSITNTGAATGYVDNEQQPGPTSGLPLSPGSTVVWQAGRPLYGACPTSTTITITENALSACDLRGNTIGPHQLATATLTGCVTA